MGFAALQSGSPVDNSVDFAAFRALLNAVMLHG